MAQANGIPAASESATAKSRESPRDQMPPRERWHRDTAEPVWSCRPPASASLRSSSHPLGARLPPGRHGPEGPSAAQVAAHQRTRLALAMIEAAGSRGYKATTVSELTKRASVSTRAFYELYPDKQRCLIDACEMVFGRLAASMAHLRSGQCDRAVDMREGFEALTRQLAQEPKAARLVLLESFSAGLPAVELACATIETFERLICESCERSPGSRRAPRLLVRGVVAGIMRVAQSYALQDRLDELPGVAGELTEWALSYVAEATASDGRELAAAPIAAEDVAFFYRSQAAHVHPRDLDLEDWLDLDGRLNLEGRLNPGTGYPDERARSLKSAIVIAGREGAAALTPAKLAREAGISQRRLRDLFASCEDCLLRAFELSCAQALDAALQADGSAAAWPQSVCRTIERFVATIASERELARVAFIEALGLGRAGVESREALLSGFDRVLLDTAPPDCRPSALAAQASVGAAWGIMRHRVLRPRERLPAPVMIGTLAYILLAPAIGAQAAAETIRGGTLAGTISQASRQKPIRGRTLAGTSP